MKTKIGNHARAVQLALAAIVAGSLLAAAPARAETIDDLLDLLKAKGAITQAEYDILKAGQRAEAKKTEQKLLDAEAKAQQAEDKLRDIEANLLQTVPARLMADPPAPPAASAASAGTDNGTDPSAFAKRVILYNDYNHLDSGIDVNVTYLDLTYPMLKDSRGTERGLLKIEMPFVYAENLEPLLPPGEPAPAAVSGFGDIMFRTAFVPWYNDSKTFKLFGGVDLYVPSAESELLFSPEANGLLDSSLGTGKYRIEPFGGFVWEPRPNMLFAPLYFHDVSVAGDPTRDDVNIGKWKIFAMYAWPNGTYVLPELQIITNYNNDKLPPSLRSNTDVFFRPEIGQVLNADGTTVYVKPGFALGDLGPLNRQWGIETGMRMKF